MCYISNLGEKCMFAGHLNDKFFLNFIIFFKKFHFFNVDFLFAKIGGKYA